MARRRYSDHDAIRKSLLTECPRCHYMIPPAELSRPGQDWNLVRCPKCQHEFIVPQKATRRISNHADDYFFLSSVLAVIVVVFVGFTPTYYLAPVFHAPALPSVIVHLHGAVFTGWILLLLVQVLLVLAGRRSWHMQLGIFGVVLAPLGPALARWPYPALTSNNWYFSSVLDLFLVFMIGFDIWSRRRPHLTTVLGASFIVAMQMAFIPIAQTAVWHRLMTLVRGF